MAAFKVDENLPVEVADSLRERGHDATTVHEQQLVGRPDSRLVEVCDAESRAMVSLDLDFCNILKYPPEQHAGFIVLRPSSQDKPRVLSVFEQVLDLLEREPVTGRLWTVNEAGIRVRGAEDEANP